MKMMRINVDAEVIQLSVYCDIIISILKYIEKMSINKQMVFAYILKKNRFYKGKVFTANSKVNIVIKALTLLNGLRDDYFYNIEFIIKAMDILVQKQIVVVGENSLLILNDKLYLSKTDIPLFFCHVLDESGNYTDRQFLKEVLDNV